jgi:hypothetical protein
VPGADQVIGAIAVRVRAFQPGELKVNGVGGHIPQHIAAPGVQHASQRPAPAPVRTPDHDAHLPARRAWRTPRRSPRYTPAGGAGALAAGRGVRDPQLVAASSWTAHGLPMACRFRAAQKCQIRQRRKRHRHAKSPVQNATTSRNGHFGSWLPA